MDYDVYKQRLYRELNMSNSGRLLKKRLFKCLSNNFQNKKLIN